MLSDDAFYFYEVSWYYLERFSSCRAVTKLPVKFQRGITPKMYRQEFWFLWSECRLMMLYISMKYHENILNRFQDIEWTWNDHCQILKRNNSKIVLTRVVLLVVCISSQNALYFYDVSWKYLEQFSSYRADTILGQIDGWTYWLTDRQPRQKQYVSTPSAFLAEKAPSGAMC